MPTPSRSDVLQLLSEHDRALHAREIASRLKVEDREYEALQRALDDLRSEGLISERPGRRFRLVTRRPAPDRVDRVGPPREAEREGTLTMSPRGFGFVASLGNVGDDVYIPPDAIHGAMHGDRVRIRVRARGARGAEGEVVAVVERGAQRVAGILRRRGQSAWLEPDDPRVRGPITLPEDIDVRGPEGNSGQDGDAAVVVITRYPELPGETPVGRLEAVLGRPGELSVEVQKILLVEGIEEIHSPEAFAEAEAFGDVVPEDMRQGREDLRHLPLPTIDPEDARDHDDAVWVERTDRGGYRAWIAIADVSSYVTPNTALDEEARRRGCSVYLPDRAIPMLPRPLSSNLCSLLPGVDRLCLCCEVELDAGANVLRRRLVRGVMRSRAKLTYGGVARALGLSSAPARQPEAEAMKEGLRVAYELSRKLRTKRLKRGALDFDLPEARVVIGEDGSPTDIKRRSEDPGMKRAYQLIEELMLLANETVAEWMVERDLPTIFRVHAPPDETKLDRFAALCEQLGIEFDVEATRDPRRLSALLKSFADHPLAPVLNGLLLRSMKQATYDVANIGHFGLASRAYLHFTSPIRRYPDLVTHRLVHKVLLGETVRKDAKAVADLTEAALQASKAERRAMEVERAVVDLYRAAFMRDKIGEVFDGTVSAVVGSGVFVALDAPYVDVLVLMEDLGAGRYDIDEEGLRVVAAGSGDSIGLGDRMIVEIKDASVFRRTVYGRRLASVERDEDERPSRRKKPAGGKGERRTVKAEKPSKRGERRAAKAAAARGAKKKAAKPAPRKKEARVRVPKGSVRGAKSTKAAKASKPTKAKKGKKR